MEWTEKYRPRNLTEIVGHRTIVKDLIMWGQDWERGVPKDRALILHGKPGIGKTSAAFALAHQLGWDVMELNASDQRTAGIIQKVAGSASKMGTFDGTTGRRLVILDEADNLHGNYDRGGARAIIDIVKKTSQPIILIANEFYDITPTLRMICKPIQFKALSSTAMVPTLKNICREEDIMVGIGVIEKIAEDANGDLRSAINDLQAVAIGNRELEIEDIATAPRDIRNTVFKVMDTIFKEPDIKSAQEAAWQVDESPEELIHWIDENLPTAYKKEQDMVDGYFQLVRADQFLGRVRRRQNYRLWRYASLLMTGGVSAVKTQKYSGYIKYQSPQFWKKLGQNKAKRTIRDSTAGKIGKLCHVSREYARSELIYFFKKLMKNREHSVDLCVELKLDPDEIAFLLDAKPTTAKIKKIYDEAVQVIQQEVEHDIEMFGGFTHVPVKQRTSKMEDVNTDKDQNRAKIDENSKKSNKSQSSILDF
jgi:replication factor C large subunit